MSSEIIILLIVCCCCLMIISGAGFWSCTGGTFDADQFDSSKCLSIGNKSDTDFVYTDPNSTPTSLEFTTCIGSIDTNETKICIDKNSGSAGIKWKWVDTDSARKCKAEVAKYRIDVSSLLDNHSVVYSYMVMGGDTDSFTFKNAPIAFLDNATIKFAVLPLSAQGRLVVQSIEKETDENTTTTLCQDTLDSAIEFSTLQVTPNVNNKPAPITCEGAVWSDWSACIKDGSPVTECGNYGMKTRKLISSDGPCQTDESQSCYTGSCPTPPSAPPPPPPQDCVLTGDWFNFTRSGLPLCVGGEKIQKRLIEVSAMYGGTCPGSTRTVPC
jgi:hypothetical protein